MSERWVAVDDYFTERLVPADDALEAALKDFGQHFASVRGTAAVA